MTEKPSILTELRNALFTERVKPGEELSIFRGQKVVFGSDPKKGLIIAPDTRSIKLVWGVKPRQLLSRAAVAIEFDRAGNITVKSLTKNNEIALQYAPRKG